MMWSAYALIIYSVLAGSTAMTGPTHNKSIICFQKVKDILILEKFERYNVFNQCTHIIVEGVLDDKTMPWNMNDTSATESYFKSYLNTREENPHLSVILGIRLTDKVCEMATHTTTRRNFIRRALNYIMRYSFDGLDLYWDSRRYNEADKKKLVQFVKEIRKRFEIHDLLLTSTFGSFDDDNQFHGNDSHLLQMSQSFDFMHFSNKNTIIDLIKTGVPSTKITIQQQMDTFYTNLFDSIACGYLIFCESMSELQEKPEISCDAQKCRVYSSDALYFENTRHIANKMRFAMRHNLAGALVFSPGNDDNEGKCPFEQDTFLDFRTMAGVNLNIPTRTMSFPRLQVVNDAIVVSLNEMTQEAQLCAQNDRCKSQV